MPQIRLAAKRRSDLYLLVSETNTNVMLHVMNCVQGFARELKFDPIRKLSHLLPGFSV